MSTELTTLDGIPQAVAPVLMHCKAVKQLSVTDQSSYDLCAEARADLKKALKDLDAKRKAITRVFDEQKAQVMAQVKPYEDEINQAISHCTTQITTFDARMQAERERQQREIEEYARKQAQEAADKAALEAIARGDMDAAEKALDSAATVAVPVLAPHKPMVGSGAHYRDNWKAEVTNLRAVIEWAIGNAPALLAVDDRQLGIMVKERKGKIEIPGVRVWNEKTLITR